MIYYVIPMLLCVGALLGRNSRGWKLFFWFCALLMVAMAGLRWETGTDWIPYYEHFCDPSSRDDLEGGYNLMVECIRACTANYTVFLCIDAALSIVLVGLTCHLILGPSAQAMIVFYCYYFLGAWFGAQRRQLAIALCFFSVYWIRKKKFIPFSICILIAAQFHVTSLTFLLAYPIYHMKRRHLAIASGIFLSFVLLVSSVGINNLLTILSNVGILEHITHRAIAYLFEGAAGESQSVISVFLGVGKRMAFVSVFYFVGSRNGDDDYARLLRIYTVSVVIYAASVSTVSIFSVISVYFSIIEVLLIPMMLIRLNLKRTHECLLLVLYCIFQTNSMLSGMPDLYIPYYSVFDHTTRMVIY